MELDAAGWTFHHNYHVSGTHRVDLTISQRLVYSTALGTATKGVTQMTEKEGLQ